MSAQCCCNDSNSTVTFEAEQTYGETPTKVSVTISGCEKCVNIKNITDPIETAIAVYLSDETVVVVNWWNLFDIIDTYTSYDDDDKTLLFKPLSVTTFDKQGVPKTLIFKNSTVSNI